jgi:hypothetical protein
LDLVKFSEVTDHLIYRHLFTKDPVPWSQPVNESVNKLKEIMLLSNYYKFKKSFCGILESSELLDK